MKNLKGKKGKIVSDAAKIDKILNILSTVAFNCREVYVDRKRIFQYVRQNNNGKMEIFDILNETNISSNNFKTVFLNSDLVKKEKNGFKYIGEDPVSIKDARKIAKLLADYSRKYYDTVTNRKKLIQSSQTETKESNESLTSKVTWVNNVVEINNDIPDFVWTEEINEKGLPLSNEEQAALDNLKNVCLKQNDEKESINNITLASINANINYIINKLDNIVEPEIIKTRKILDDLPKLITNMSEGVDNFSKLVEKNR